MRIGTIKLLRDSLTLKWSTKSGEGDTVEHALQNGEEPSPELSNAVSDLKSYWREALGLPPKWCETVTMTGLQVSYSEDGSAKVTITAKKKVKDGRVVPLNSPTFRQRTDAGQKGAAFMDDDMWGEIQAAFGYAKDYIEGRRAQATIDA